MDSNLYVYNDKFSDTSALNEYYNLKQKLALTKEEQEIIKNLPLLRGSGTKCRRGNKTEERKEQTMFDNDLQLEYPKHLEPMITAIKNGWEDYADIEEHSKINRHNLSVYFGTFFKYLEKQNLISKSGKTQKQAVIDFIGSRILDNSFSASCHCEDEQSEDVAIQSDKKPKNPPKAKSNFSFDDPLSEEKINLKEVKERVMSKISKLQEMLKAIELLENELEEVLQ